MCKVRGLLIQVNYRNPVSSEESKYADTLALISVNMRLRRFGGIPWLQY